MIEKGSEKDLMLRIANGDERAFELLFKAYYARLVVFARKFVSDSDLAQSLVQAVFVRLWEKRAQLKVETPLAYLMVAVRNHCLNELKDQKHFKLLDLREMSFVDAADDTFPDVDVIEKVQEVISEMPPQRQKIFRMNRFDGFKYREIAVTLGLSIKTVEAQMGKALQFLRENLPRVIKEERFS